MKAMMPLAMFLGLGLSAAATAQDDVGAQLSKKRQLVVCMNKQMAANRVLSYNDATRLCKERAKDQQMAASNAASTGVSTKPGT